MLFLVLCSARGGLRRSAANGKARSRAACRDGAALIIAKTYGVHPNVPAQFHRAVGSWSSAR